MVLLFFNFLDLKIKFRLFLRKELFFTFFLSVIVMPTFTYYLLSYRFEFSFRVGLLLVACAPSGIMSVLLINYLNSKDIDLALSNLLFTTFGSILFIPFILKYMLGKTVVIEIRPIILQTAILIIIPFLGTRVINVFPSHLIFLFIRKISNYISPIIVFFIILISIGSSTINLTYDIKYFSLFLSVFGIYLFQSTLAFSLGCLLKNKAIRNTLTLISSSRNCQIILSIAILNFSPSVTIPIIIAIILHHVMNSFWLFVLQD